MKNLTLIVLIGLALVSCEADPIEDATFNSEITSKPEVIDLYEDTSHGLGGN